MILLLSSCLLLEHKMRNQPDQSNARYMCHVTEYGKPYWFVLFVIICLMGQVMWI